MFANSIIYLKILFCMSKYDFECADSSNMLADFACALFCNPLA